jgi:N-acetylmuramoyl-L-alanine amidase
MVENSRFDRSLIRLTLVLAFIVTLSFLSIKSVEAANNITIELDGKKLQGSSNLSVIKDGRVFVPVRFIAEEIGVDVDWISVHKKVILTKRNSKVELVIGSKNFKLNGKKQQLDVSPFIYKGRTLVPLRLVANGLGLDVQWDVSSRTVVILHQNKAQSQEAVSRSKATAPQSPSRQVSYSEDDLYWLAKMIYAEARGETMAGQVAVGAVILNRVEHPNFPKTVRSVIFEKWGIYYQFEPVQNGSIYRLEPGATAYQAAKSALAGEDPTKGALFFHNPKISKSDWMASKPVAIRIGNHEFMY